MQPVSIELDQHRIPQHECFYVPDFVTREEEEYLIRKISDTPKKKWKRLSNRRLQIWGGEVTAKNTLITQALPPFLTVYPDITTRLKASGFFESSPHGAPNHVIINEYLPGQGIMPHQDGPAYHPIVATISLGSHTVFHYHQYRPSESVFLSPNDTDRSQYGVGRSIDPSPVLTVLLEPRSLVVTTSKMYTEHLHSIREISEDRTIPGTDDTPPKLADLGSEIANWRMLTNERIKKTVKEGGVLHREVRYSLTCRDIGRVSSAKSYMRI